MKTLPTLAVAAFGAGALVGSSLLTDAFASQPAPNGAKIQSAANKKYSVSGDLTVTGVLRVNKNLSVNGGRLYAHQGEQVWKGLLIHDGGVQADSLNSSGPIQGASATIAGNLTAGAISGSSLAIQNAATVGSTLNVGGGVTAGGAIKGNGLDAGGGNITTTGQITAGSITTTGALTAASLNVQNTQFSNLNLTGDLTTSGSVNAKSGTGNFATINDTGALTAGSVSSTGTISTTGALTGGTLSGVSNGTLHITGPVDFSGATVSGLNGGGTNLGSGTVSTLNVGTGCTTYSTSGPLNVCQGGQTANIGVNSSGALVVGSVATSGGVSVGGNLQANGSQGLLTNTITAITNNSNGAIAVNGNLQLVNGSDLLLSSGSNNGTYNRTHIVAQGDTDVAGTVTVNNINSTSTTSSANVTFGQTYAVNPIVVITPTSDPGNLRYWVSNVTTSGFTVYVQPTTYNNATTINYSTPYNMTFNYMVIGG